MPKIKFTAYFWKCPVCGSRRSDNSKIAPQCNSGLTDDGFCKQHPQAKMELTGQLACEARVEITILPPED